MRRTTFAFVLMLSASLAARAQQPPARRPAAVADINPRGLFQLYPTQNIYTLILLNSSDGKAWQVQYGLGEAVPSRVPINLETLNVEGLGHAGRYTLVPTQNMFTFILVDQDTGRLWQLQWNVDEEKRFINALP